LSNLKPNLTAPIAPEEDRPSEIGRYRIARRIAEGGMAELFLGVVCGESGFRRPVAIKRVLPQFANDRMFVDMFVDEALLLSKIRHPNVVQVEELGLDGDRHFFAMELIQGENVSSIGQRLRASSRELPVEMAAWLVAEVAAGLHATHELRSADGELLHVVHRDVSPHNILVSFDGFVKLIDFGIARADERLSKTRTGAAKGKFAYMAPEQCQGSASDRQVDVFALGVVLHELLTGSRLFRRRTEAATLTAFLQEEILKPSDINASISPELDRITMLALERDPDLRYKSAAALRIELRRYLATVAPQFDGTEAWARMMGEIFSVDMLMKATLLEEALSGIAPAPSTDVHAARDRVPVTRRARRNRTVPASTPPATRAPSRAATRARAGEFFDFD